MRQTLQQIVERVLDPAAPVIWVAPSTTEDVWSGLPQALSSSGFRVYALNDATGYASLMNAISAAIPIPRWTRPDFNSLKDSLLSLDDGGERGWVLVFRHPEALRSGDEEAFEDFLEVLEVVNDILIGNRQLMFKLILPD